MFSFCRRPPTSDLESHGVQVTLNTESSELVHMPFEPSTTWYRWAMRKIGCSNSEVAIPYDKFPYFDAIEALQIIIDQSIYPTVRDKERHTLAFSQALRKKIVDKKLMSLLALSSFLGAIAFYATFSTTMDYMTEMFEFIEVAVFAIPEIIQPFISVMVSLLRSGFYFAATAYTSSQLLYILADKYAQNALGQDDLQKAIESLKFYQKPRWKVLMSNLGDFLTNGFINVLPALPYMIGYGEFSRTLTLMLMVTNIFGPGQYAIRNMREGLTGTESLSQRAIVEHTDRALQRFLKLNDDQQQMILDELKFLIEKKLYKAVYYRLLNIDEPTQGYKFEIGEEGHKNLPWLLPAENPWPETIASQVGRAAFVVGAAGIIYDSYAEASEKINYLKLWRISLPAILVAAVCTPSNLSNPYLAGQTLGEDLTTDNIPMSKLFVPMLRRMIKIGIITIVLLPTGLGIETNVASIRLTKDFIHWVGGNAEHPFAVAVQAIFGGVGGLVDSATMGLFCLWAVDAAIGNFMPECGTPHQQRLCEFVESYRLFQESLKEAVPYQWRTVFAWMLDEKNVDDPINVDEESGDSTIKAQSPEKSATDLSALILQIIEQRVSAKEFAILIESYAEHGAKISPPQERGAVVVMEAGYYPNLFGSGLRRRNVCKPELFSSCTGAPTLK